MTMMIELDVCMIGLSGARILIRGKEPVPFSCTTSYFGHTPFLGSSLEATTLLIHDQSHTIYET
jgi:hypothetical protein